MNLVDFILHNKTLHLWLNVYESTSRGLPFENALWLWDAFIAKANAIVLKNST
jgi:hypothetical protein